MGDVTLFDKAAQAVAEAGDTQGALRALSLSKADSAGKAFMKLDKRSGKIVYGADETEAEPEERWAINPHSFKIGVIGWKNGKPVDEIMHSIASGQRVDKAALPEIVSEKDGDGWKDQLSIELKCLDHGTEALYATTSKGGKDAFAELAGKIEAQMSTNPSLPVPVVHLKSDWYKHKTYGKIFTPVLEVVDWISLDGPDAKPTRKQLA